MKNTLRIVFLAFCALAPVREVSAAFLIRDGKLQTDLNANTNRITNATDYVTAGGISLTNAYALAAAGGGSGATNFIFNAVTNSSGYLLFTGYTSTTRTAYFDIGTNSGTSIDTNAVIALINASTNTSARLDSNIWAAAASTTNYVARTGDTMTGNLIITNASITVKSDSINAQFSDARGAAGVLLQTGSPSAATNTYGVVKLQDSGPSAGYGTLYFDSRVSPTGLWIKASGTNRWNVWDQRNDGAGSGLDADLLDGLESTNFAQLASSPTFTGTITAGGFSGNGAGLTNLSVSSPSRVSVPVVWGGFRSQTTNSSVLPVRGFVGGDSLTATSALAMLSFVVSATNAAQEKFGVAEISWPMTGATGITVTTYFQTSANGMSLVFYNGVSNAVAYPIAGVAGTSTTNLSASGFLTSAVQGDSVQVTCFSTNISTNAASTVVNGIGQKIMVTK